MADESIHIKIGDWVMDTKGREGPIERITLGLSQYDPAGESGPEVEEFQIRKEIFTWGSLVFKDNWAYFDQVMKVWTGEEAIKKKEEYDELFS